MSTPNSPPESGDEWGGTENFESPEFEVAPAKLAPHDFLPASLLRGDHHEVRSISLERDFSHRYHVDSDGGEFDVRSLGLLRKRIHELEILAGLRSAGVEDRDIYVLAFANAAGSPVEGGMQLLVHPIRTTTNIPRGFWEMARGYYEMTSGGRTYLEDDYIDELIGFGRAKREWGYRLGVDVYSANPNLQEALDHYGWLSLAGGLSVRLPLIAVPGGASIALSVTNTSDDMKRELRDRTPEDIRLYGRKILTGELGIDESLAAEFVYHSWYSPSRLAVIVESLVGLQKATRFDAFISSAAKADSPGETHSFVRLAQLIAAFDREVEGIEEFFLTADLITARTTNGRIVLPLYFDSAYWTRRASERFDRLERDLSELAPSTEKILLISGNISSRARREAESRGWRVMDGLEFSWLAEADRLMFRAGEPDAERILPEIGG